MKISICISTYKRPKGLERLLNSIVLQELSSWAELKWDIIIIDNDTSLPNKDLVDKFSNPKRPIFYECEEVRSIAASRNHACRLAKDADFVAFIDDDEIADVHWLNELLRLQKSTDADVIFGPTIAIFESKVPEWISEGGWFNCVRNKTGTRLKIASTNNVLVKSKWIKGIKGPFDERLKLTGGEDSLFFKKVNNLGGVIIWSNSALVYEYIPHSRSNLNWMVKRAFRLGNSSSTIDILSGLTFKNWVIRFLKGLTRLVVGFLSLLPLLILRGLKGLVKSILLISQGLGEICGVFGVKYNEYKVIHGS